MKPRTHIIGLDKPTALPLSSAAQPQQVLAEQAAKHESHRQEAVSEMMVLVGLMSAKMVLTGHETVTVKGAIFQFGQGVRAHATIAAHCLPGHLMLNGIPIHQMQDWNPVALRQKGMKALPLSSKLRNLFGRTDVVDESLNDVDSWLEKMSDERGLKFLFGRSVQLLLQQITLRKPATTQMLKPLIDDAFDRYRLGATYVCEERVDRLAQVFPGISFDAKNPTRRLIAGRYLAVLRNRAFVPESITQAGFERVVRDVLV